jgi:hypothetical protein
MITYRFDEGGLLFPKYKRALSPRRTADLEIDRMNIVSNTL